ncbi:MAG: hypothetical protein JXQ73_07605 [Phycisphaerae bacterium]|nr:hypothetical protein [Phycisphaerae bacterium]
MFGKSLVLGACLVAAVCLVAPVSVQADYFDDFSDGVFKRNDPNNPQYDANDPYYSDPNYMRDPNLWDLDNPDWFVNQLVGVSFSYGIGSDAVADKALRLAVTGYTIGPAPFGVIAAGVQYANTSIGEDPNVSPTWWDDTTDHYFLSWCYYTNYPANPNSDRGRIGLLMHADPIDWTCFVFEKDFDNKAYTGWRLHEYHTHHLNLQSMAFTRVSDPDWGYNPVWNFKRIWLDPNGCRDWQSLDPNTADPNDTTWFDPGEDGARDPNLDDPKWLGIDLDGYERNGFWLLFQFKQDPNYDSGDPNGKFVMGAVWNGDKYDWDGEWLLEGELPSEWSSGRMSQDPGLAWYWPEGVMAVCVQSDVEWLNGYPADAAIDNVECRTGVFSNAPKLLDLRITNANYGQVLIDPKLTDPNDPNTTSNRLLRYTEGTEVVLVAEAIEGKSFKQWTIHDPNHPMDANFALAVDSNSTLYLTMDEDMIVEAAFKCGSGMPPFIAVALLALGLGVVIRRLS